MTTEAEAIAKFDKWYDALPTNRHGDKTLNHEYETTAELNGHKIGVVVSYERDGMEALIYGVFEAGDPENDITTSISQAEFDRLSAETDMHIMESMVADAEYVADMER